MHGFGFSDSDILEQLDEQVLFCYSISKAS